MTVLITGGAGYIGSITNFHLRKQGYDTIIFDSLSVGHKAACDETPLIVGDLRNYVTIDDVFKKHHIDAVVHFAAFALAGESMIQPYKYFLNNIVGGLNLLEVMRKHACKDLIFSSTCAVYGYPKKIPVSEETETKPISVYGSSKLQFEDIIHRYEEIYGLRAVILRYFNASGATLDGKLGEDHFPETHIIPNAMMVALGQKDKFKLYGNDYHTPDGTCIRDYIHVLDLARAHEQSLQYLKKNNRSLTCNLGSGKGYSNKEILHEIETVIKSKIPLHVARRRPGDPDEIYTQATKAKKELGWTVKYSDLETIIRSAWKWHSTHPLGYNTTRSGSSR